jgi:hypothetical protein
MREYDMLELELLLSEAEEKCREKDRRIKELAGDVHPGVGELVQAAEESALYPAAAGRWPKAQARTLAGGYSHSTPGQLGPAPGFFMRRRGMRPGYIINII